jgi:hypothetical protein
MRQVILRSLKMMLLSASICIASITSGQQNIIADKDNTHPELNKLYGSPARITSFTATPHNGYNDIQWSALSEKDTRKFVVEYSRDWVDFQTAGELMATTGHYELAHKTFDVEPLVYRIRVEDLNGKSFYSKSIVINGVGLSPVKIYPTTISGNIVNAVAEMPVERVTVFSSDGKQVFAQDIGGKRDYLDITIPSLSRGMYWMNFAGRDWKTTSNFIVQ